MPRLSDLALGALYSDPLMSDAAELVADEAALAGSGTACRIQLRGREAGLEQGSFSISAPLDEYTIRVRVSELATVNEGQVFINSDTGLRYRVIEVPTLQGPDRAEWLCFCRVVA